ncbi:MAG: hypothetical protein ABSE70_05205 [Candidatus Limnocylindrales bacterium]
MNDERDLKDRLTAIEGRAPAFEPPPLAARRRRPLALSLAAATLLVLVVATTAVAGVAVVSGMVRGYPGIENPGQPLAGATMECMSPPQAAAYLAAHGFTDVVWQVESGGPGKPDGSTTLVSTPPAHGYVVPGAILDDGKPHMIVDQRPGATGTGVCSGMPMP